MTQVQKRELDEIIESTYNNIMALPGADEQNEAAKEMLLFGSGIRVGEILSLRKQAS